jgi:ATP-dependent helicase YprA (DUF1998 family)
MATTDTELKDSIRKFTGIDAETLSDEEFDTVISDAKRHIKLRRSLEESQVDWYGDEHQQEALNWTAKLFLKVATGDLDEKTVQVGAIDEKHILAKDDNEVTVWHRNMERAIRNINPAQSYGIRSPARREYGTDDLGSGDDVVQL